MNVPSNRDGSRAALHRAAGLLLLGATSAVLAGCSSSAAATHGASSSTSTGAPTTASLSPSPSAATTSHGAPTTKNCTNAEITVSSRPLGAALSHSGVLVIFSNVGTHACQLFGYPGAAALDAHNTQYEQARRTTDGYLSGRDRGVPRIVVLHPGDKASSVVEGAAVGIVDDCQRGRALLVTPPNTTRATRLAFPGYFCGLEVHPVVAGGQR